MKIIIYEINGILFSQQEVIPLETPTTHNKSQCTIKVQNGCLTVGYADPIRLPVGGRIEIS